MQNGAAAVDGDGAHEHGIAEAAEGRGGSVDEVDGGDALGDEVLDEVAAQDERGADVWHLRPGERLVIELREQVQMIAGAHTGEHGDEPAISRGESCEHGGAGLLAEVGEEAAVALLAFTESGRIGVPD